jgi:hypothetical protein
VLQFAACATNVSCKSINSGFSYFGFLVISVSPIIRLNCYLVNFPTRSKRRKNRIQSLKGAYFVAQHYPCQASVGGQKTIGFSCNINRLGIGRLFPGIEKDGGNESK